MIPTIETIIDMLLHAMPDDAKQIGKCRAWLHEHLRLAEQRGRDDGARVELRDMFIAAAMPACIAQAGSTRWPEEIATQAVRVADAMLEARQS